MASCCTLPSGRRTNSRPARSVTNIAPSGANATSHGLLSPVITGVTVSPVAASTGRTGFRAVAPSSAARATNPLRNLIAPVSTCARAGEPSPLWIGDCDEATLVELDHRRFRRLASTAATAHPVSPSAPTSAAAIASRRPGISWRISSSPDTASSNVARTNKSATGSSSAATPSTRHGRTGPQWPAQHELTAGRQRDLIGLADLLDVAAVARPHDRALARARCRCRTSPTTPTPASRTHSGDRASSKLSRCGPFWTMIWLTPNRST